MDYITHGSAMSPSVFKELFVDISAGFGCAAVCQNPPFHPVYKGLQADFLWPSRQLRLSLATLMLILSFPIAD